MTAKPYAIDIGISESHTTLSDPRKNRVDASQPV